MWQAAQQAVTVKNPLRGHGGFAFEPNGEEVQATVLPIRGTLTAQAYGLRPDEARRLIADPYAPIARGQGVCVEAQAGEDPDFVVLHAARWPGHLEAHLRFIPKEQRGVDE